MCTWNFWTYSWIGIRNLQPIIVDEYRTVIFGALITLCFIDFFSLGSFSSMVENSPVHPFLMNHQDMKHFAYLCIDAILKGDMDPHKEGQGKYLIPWVRQYNKG